MPEHNILTGTALHEPKGTATAPANTSYIANGLGSGTWKAASGQVYGEMRVTTNVTAKALTAAGDGTLNTNEQYAKLDSGLWSAGTASGVTYNASGYLEITTAGVYEISLWASMVVSVINTLTALKFSKDDTTGTLSTRKLSRLSGAAGDTGSLAASAFEYFPAGSKISMWAAANKNCNLTLVDAGFTAVLLKAD